MTRRERVIGWAGIAALGTGPLVSLGRRLGRFAARSSEGGIQCWAHNPEVAGSNPAPATTFSQVRPMINDLDHGPADRLTVC